MITLMETAEKLGMTSSEYVYFYFNLLPVPWVYKPWLPFIYTRPKDFKEEDYEYRKKLFYSLKQVDVISLF